MLRGLTAFCRKDLGPLGLPPKKGNFAGGCCAKLKSWTETDMRMEKKEKCKPRHNDEDQYQAESKLMNILLVMMLMMGEQTSVVVLIHHLRLPQAPSRLLRNPPKHPPHTMLTLHHLFSCLAFQTFYNILIKSNVIYQRI